MLQLALFDTAGGSLIADWSARARNVRAGTGEHGFGALSFDVAMGLVEAFEFYDRPGLPHVLLSDGAYTVFEGRLEDVQITDTGISCQAFGYWRAFADVPYTALWAWTRLTATGMNGWKEITTLDLAQYACERYNMWKAMDPAVGGLLLGPIKGQRYGTPNYYAGGYYWETPATSASKIATITFSYTLVAPAGWSAMIGAYDRSWGSGATVWILAGNGAVQSGTVTVNLVSPRERITFALFQTTAEAEWTAAANCWARIGQVTLAGTTATVTSDAIVKALVGHVVSYNPSQLSPSTLLIGAPGVTLTDEMYEDTYPAEILTKLAALGDSASPPNAWEVGVWEGQRLHFRVRNAMARAWYVDASGLSLQRSLDTLWNSAYATYQDAAGRTQRTAAAGDNARFVRYGVIRQAAIAVKSTTAAQTILQRNAFLGDNWDPHPQAGIRFDALYDASGARWPLYMARAGDTITIRNLPPTLSADIDRIRTFRISATEYSCDDDVLTVTPDRPLPAVDVLLAQAAEGIG